MPESHNQDGNLGTAAHLRISVGLSAVISSVLIAVTWGISWGTYSARLAAQEAESERTEALIATNTRTNSAQEVTIARITTQYDEILRRLDKIDRKIGQ